MTDVLAELFRGLTAFVFMFNAYSVSPYPGSDVARLFAKSSSKLRAPCEIARTHKNIKEYGLEFTSCVSVVTSLPVDGVTEYNILV